MNRAAPNLDPQAVLRTLRILVGAMVAGVVIFTIICIVLVQSGSFAPTLPAPPAGAPTAPVAGMHPVIAILGLVGGAMAIFVAPVGLIIRAKMLASARDPQTGVVAPGAFSSATILACALFESFGILGAVLILLSGSLIPGLPLVGLSILFMAVIFPSRRALTPNVYAGADDDTAYNREP